MKQHHFDSALMGGAPNSVQTIDAMLQNDTILPSQFYGSRNRGDDRVREAVTSAHRNLDNGVNPGLVGDPGTITHADPGTIIPGIPAEN